MACSLEYIDFICMQLEGIGIIRTRKMFGDWCVYVDEKPIILACDNQCYIKIHPVIEHLMTDSLKGYPYEGAKEHYILDIEHAEDAKEIIKILVQVLPYPKPKKKK